MSATLKMIVTGRSGRMGSEIIRLIHEKPDLTFVGSDPSDSTIMADVIVDFTRPAGTLAFLESARTRRWPMVIGTTGFTADEFNKISEAARVIPIVYSANMSIGINLLWKLAETAAGTLPNFRIAIEEIHHIHKQDRPSGTAKELGRRAARGSGHHENEIMITSIRQGETIGDHRMTFTSDSEALEISHRALSRRIFAEGALAAARWIVATPPGLYGMDDVLKY